MLHGLSPLPPPDAVRRPILVIDDDEDARALVCDLLRREGYATLAAANGKAALDLLMDERKVDPTLIVLDLRMPTMSGWEFVAIVKSYARFASLPIIVTTGGPVRPGALRDGAVAAWIQKPFDAARFLDVVRTRAGAPRASR